MTVARGHKGGAKATTLNGGITNSATSFAVATGGGTGYPDGSTGVFVMTLDVGNASEEKVLCSARTGDTFTVTTRGYDDTAAVAHVNNAIVKHTYSAIEAQEANDHIVKTTADDHTQYGLVKKTLLAARAAIAHRSMQFWYGIDNDYLSVDDGTNWHDFPSKAVNDGLYLGLTATAADSSKLGGTAAASFQTTAAANAAYAPISGSANYAPATGSTVYVGKADAQYAAVETAESTTSTSPADLTTAGPAVTVTVGATGRVKVEFAATMWNNTVNAFCYAGVALSGANTQAAAAIVSRTLTAISATANQRTTPSRAYIISGLAAGSTTFTLKYLIDASTGGTANFSGRSLLVTPL